MCTVSQTLSDVQAESYWVSSTDELRSPDIPLRGVSTILEKKPHPQYNLCYPKRNMVLPSLTLRCCTPPFAHRLLKERRTSSAPSILRLSQAPDNRGLRPTPKETYDSNSNLNAFTLSICSLRTPTFFFLYQRIVKSSFASIPSRIANPKGEALLWGSMEDFGQMIFCKKSPLGNISWSHNIL